MTGHKNKKGFTLAELIVAIALLAVFSTLIVQIFAKAQAVTQKAESLDLAVNLTSDLADQWKRPAGQAGYQAISDLQQNLQNGRSAIITLDEAFYPCDAKDAAWQASLLLQKGDEPGYWLLKITVQAYPDKGEKELYSLEAGHYFSGEEGTP